MKQDRLQKAIQSFQQSFGANRSSIYCTVPGRTEIAGNHTDHQHGCVLAASVDLDIIAVVSPNADKIVRIESEGYPLDQLDLRDLAVHEEEKNSSRSLIRGVAAGFSAKGLPIGGFDAYLTSDVPQGSGLSSSAAYEVMVGTIFSQLYCEGKVDPLSLAQMGQFAENQYFGKPSGLMDQTACAVGGFVFLDFYNPAQPLVEKIEFDFASSGHQLCIIDAGGSHADLTQEYASIPGEMRQVSEFFGKEFLREISPDSFYSQIAKIRATLSDRAVLRAHHFFSEQVRVQEMAQALRQKDFEWFLSLSNASGHSSFEYLQNVFASSVPAEQCLSVALFTAQRLLNGKGACRVHGGGFGGTIQAFVPNELVDRFRSGMEEVTGANTCHFLAIRAQGCGILERQ